jgi:hypothetical protein
MPETPPAGLDNPLRKLRVILGDAEGGDISRKVRRPSRYRLLIQIELEKYLGPFNTLRFGESKPFHGTCKRSA